MSMTDQSGLLKTTGLGANMYTLIIWGFIAYPASGWRPILETNSLALCEAAAVQLQLKPNTHRCIQTK